MLPPFIIEQIKRREEEVENDRDRPQPTVDVPLPPLPPPSTTPREDDNRGIIVIDLMG